MLRFEKYLFFALVLLALSIILIPKFYITGDGPSHTYNAKVLFDIIRNDERAFYLNFYDLQRHIDPNWTGHLIIGAFLQVFPYWLSDKLFQVLYVLVFAFGFRFLIRSVYPDNGFLSFLFFPFLFTLAFQQGFYNYSLAIGLMCWTMGWFMRIKNQLDNPVKLCILSVLILLTAFSHGMPVFYLFGMIVMIWAAENRQHLLPFNGKKISGDLSRLVLAFMPSMLLLILFILKRGTGRVPHSLGWNEKLLNFLTMYGSQSTRQAEVFPAAACLLLLIVYLFILVFTPSRVHIRKQMTAGYVFLGMSLLTLISYLTCPHSIGGAGSIDIRLVFLPPLFLLLFFSTKQWTEGAKRIFIGASCLISLVFLAIRFPYVMKANAIAQEIMSAGNAIDDKAVVLNIHYDYWQRLPKGDSLFHHDGSFLHVSDYLGALDNKHLILLNNYEAEINYFPLNWKAGMNPRQSIPGMIQGELPPCGDYRAYEKQVSHQIDYIVMQQWQSKYISYPCVRDFMQMLHADFDKVYQSQHNYVIVYKRRPGSSVDE